MKTVFPLFLIFLAVFGCLPVPDAENWMPGDTGCETTDRDVAFGTWSAVHEKFGRKEKHFRELDRRKAWQKQGSLRIRKNALCAADEILLPKEAIHFPFTHVQKRKEFLPQSKFIPSAAQPLHRSIGSSNDSSSERNRNNIHFRLNPTTRRVWFRCSRERAGLMDFRSTAVRLRPHGAAPKRFPWELRRATRKQIHGWTMNRSLQRSVFQTMREFIPIS